MSVDQCTEHESVEEPAEEPVEEGAEERAGEADHDLVMATARRIIATDAAIIHRLGTV
jgi:hypothetical protein